ncbi:MAG: EF-P beta-lysylation protein EpmB [Chlamydia sp. 32-24]|nr:MAG: EF-P beta-lysylation protein EpmB [Chlamydia sp. 32-24]
MTWKSILKTNFTNIDKLINYLQLDEKNAAKVLRHSKFIFNLPYRLAQKIEKNNVEDPLFKQFVPTIEELAYNPNFLVDPVQDQSFGCTKKLLQKYNGRALLVSTSACAMHCRYCFRQNFPYETKVKGFEEELSWLKNNSSVKEVILSGGDPLSLPNANLHNFIQECEKISHIKRIRFHTRFIIGIPERIDDEFIAMLKKSRFSFWFILHINHPREIDQDIIAKIDQLKRIGCNVLNQAVLLKNVNDNVETLVELCETLIDANIIPYYLHQLDRVQGAQHFEVKEEKGHFLIKELEKRLPGFAVPKYVKEIAGEPNKTRLLPVLS